ncbi:hypothetical protein [Noviherbaspirillum denitrificans]|uniref:NrfJ n=1 Tax=Noviherbaspirillum denitrificans TaxID=1968433 RepID=A0A254TFJ9_9BURK|nr:hypothetical protein [Noviherbaspirillum denitrificans]OWW21411.1 hypothetical protein AYR66_19910 [Noviherbaspirillum denitrificans]
MKAISALFAIAALAVSVSVQAAPTGHPSPSMSADMLKAPKNTPDADLPLKGKVLSTLDASEYTYIEVAKGKETLWLAAPKVAVKKDAVVRFEDGAVMTNFRSKLLDRTFPSVMFVNRVVVTNEKP